MNSTIVLTMPNFTNPTGQHWTIAYGVATLSGGTVLLLHPSVPRLSRALHVSGLAGANLIFGYAAHATAYFIMTFAVLRIVSAERERPTWWVLALLLIHGFVTEMAQLGIPGRTWDPLDLAANLSAVTLAAVLYRNGRRASLTDPGLPRPVNESLAALTSMMSTMEQTAGRSHER